MIAAAVLGSPIAHSLSPLLHNTAYQFLGIQARYKARDVPSGQLRDFLSGDGAELNSVSLTMPLKEEALSIADSVSALSAKIHSGNTLHKVDGHWSLTSTDVEGFSHALAFNGKDARGRVLIIGAGATARAVVAACDGVSDTVSVINRSTDREQAIRKSGPGLDIEFLSWTSSMDFSDYELVVNTTPGDTASIFADQVESVGSTFFEVLYNPFPTHLLNTWRKAGGFGIDGLDLLIHQAISQIEIFSGQTIEREEMAKMLRVVGEKALT